jgi:hypothetical protein
MVYDIMRGDISADELERRLAEPGGSSLDDILSRLEKA